jgi:DNA polymerase III epsilon subunit-like protein
MKFLSIDLETTSLNPLHGVILELACVVFDTKDYLPKPEHESSVLPFYHTFIAHGHAVPCDLDTIDFLTLNNPKLFQNSHHASKHSFDVDIELRQFIYGHFQPDDPILLCSKNPGSFELPWLRRHLPQTASLFHHRLLDPTIAMTFANDKVPPSLKTLAHRLGRVLDTTQHHDALYDARFVGELMCQVLLGQPAI